MIKTTGYLFLLAAFLVLLAVANAGEIHEAAKTGDVGRINALLDKDPRLLYAKDEEGKTPLHWADGGTPLHVAASQAQPEAAKILIQYYALIDARTKDGSTPLHFAALKGRKPGHIEVAGILIQNGADVNARMNNGSTPLALALSRGNTEMVALLRKNGAKEYLGTKMQQGQQRKIDQSE